MTLKLVPKETSGEMVEASNVVRLPATIWEHLCGSQRFVLRKGGVVECAWCGKLLPDKTWGDK